MKKQSKSKSSWFVYATGPHKKLVLVREFKSERAAENFLKKLRD